MSYIIVKRAVLGRGRGQVQEVGKGRGQSRAILKAIGATRHRVATRFKLEERAKFKRYIDA